jgi:ORF6N domain
MISLLDVETGMAAPALPDLKNEIHLVRGERVMLDSALAAIYGVSTKRLNEQLQRNRKRFPIDFAFQLTREEFTNLKSQIATSSSHGRSLIEPAPTKKREIGFHVAERASRYRARKKV